MVVVFVFILAYGVDPMWTWLLLPLLLVALVVLTTAVSMLLSALYVRFRDVAIIWAVVGDGRSSTRPRCSTRSRSCPETLRDAASLNPLAPIFEQARVWIIDPNAPGRRRGGRRLPAAADPGRDLRRCLCVARRLDLQPRGAADRRGALGAPRLPGRTAGAAAGDGLALAAESMRPAADRPQGPGRFRPRRRRCGRAGEGRLELLGDPRGLAVEDPDAETQVARTARPG